MVHLRKNISNNRSIKFIYPSIYQHPHNPNSRGGAHQRQGTRRINPLGGEKLSGGGFSGQCFLSELSDLLRSAPKYCVGILIPPG